jgi:TP901 family phage tail tape measure protein
VANETVSTTFDLIARDRASRVFDRVGRSADGADRNMSRFGNTLTRVAQRAAIGVTAALGGAALAIARVGMSYQDSLNVFQAATHATDKEMNAVRATAKKLGANLTLPATSAADAAEAMTELAKGGLSVRKSMRAALGTLQLAAAAQVDGATAAKIQAAALSQFRLSADKAGKVADILANTANAASGEITDVANALTYVGPVARNFGVSIGDTAATLGLLAKNGILSQKAGTGLRGILVSLANPSEKAAGALEKLGVNAFNAQGKFKGMPYLIDTLAKAQKNLTKEEFNQAAAAAFGREPLAAISALAAEGSGNFDKMAKAVGRQGGAADLAAAKSKGLRGALEGIKSQLETVAINIYEKAEPAVSTFLRKVAEKIPAAATAIGDFGTKVANMGQAISEKLDLSGLFSRAQEIGNGLIAAFNVGLASGDWGPLGKTLGDGLARALQGVTGAGSAIARAFAGVDWLSLGKKAGAAALPFVVGFVNEFLGAIIPFILHHPLDALLLASAIIPAGRLAGALERIVARIPIVRSILGPILRALAGSGKAVEGAAGNVFRGIVTALEHVAPQAVGAVRALGGRIAYRVFSWYVDAAAAAARVGVRILQALLKPFAGIGDKLIHIGAELIGGLIRGIDSMIKPLTSKLGWITSKIPDWKGPHDKDRKLLIPAGIAIMAGLIDGFEIGSRKVKDKLQDLTDSIRDKLSGLRTDAANILSSVGDSVRGAVDVSAFGAPIVTGQDADGNDITRTPGIGETASGFVTQAKAFVDALRQMSAKKLAPSLIAAVAAAGPVGGLQAAQAFASATDSEIASVNTSIGAIDSLAKQAGNIVIKTTKIPSDIKREEERHQELKELLKDLSGDKVATLRITKGGDLIVEYVNETNQRNRRRG